MIAGEIKRFLRDGIIKVSRSLRKSFEYSGSGAAQAGLKRKPTIEVAQRLNMT